MNLWLDDLRYPPRDWELFYMVKTAPDAIRALKERRFDFELVSLDHDLGPPEAGTGYDVLRWIEDEVHGNPTYEPPIMRVHSANPVARERMEKAIQAIEDFVGQGRRPRDEFEAKT